MGGLLHTLIKPDHDDDPEQGLVAQAANILQIGEFQLLQLAYFEWHGEEMSEAVSDQLFRDYMLRAEVPAWGRHFARRIIRQDEAGLIDANDPAYHRYDRDYGTAMPKSVRQFAVICVVLVSVFAGWLLVGHFGDPSTTSILPPFDIEDSDTTR